MIEEVLDGNPLAASVDAVVNPVNTVGVMGAGLAKLAKSLYPDVYSVYRRACENGQVAIGHMFVVERPGTPRYVINFPTKGHWRNPSHLSYIKLGLIDLIRVVRELDITSIAIPALGCRNGGLSWVDVKPLIVSAFAPLPDVQVALYPPPDPTLLRPQPL